MTSGRDEERQHRAGPPAASCPAAEVDPVPGTRAGLPRPHGPWRTSPRGDGPAAGSGRRSSIHADRARSTSWSRRGPVMPISSRAIGGGSVVRVERRAHGGDPVADPRLHRAERDAERLGDLGVAQARSSAGARARSAGRAAAGGTPVRSGRSRPWPPTESTDPPSPTWRSDTSARRWTAPRLVVAGVHDEAPQPGVEAVRVAEPRDLAPGADERLLGGVLGAIRVAEDQAGQGVQAGRAAADERRERVVVTVHRATDVRGAHRAVRPRLPVRSIDRAAARIACQAGTAASIGSRRSARCWSRPVGVHDEDRSVVRADAWKARRNAMLRAVGRPRRPEVAPGRAGCGVSRPRSRSAGAASSRRHP